VTPKAVAETAEVVEPIKDSESSAHAQEAVTPTEAKAEANPPIASANDAAKELVGDEKPRRNEMEGQPPVAGPSGEGSPESEVYVDALTLAGTIDDGPVADEKPEEKDADDEDDKRTIVDAYRPLGSAAKKPVVNGALSEELVHVNGAQESENEVVDEEESVRKEKEEKTRVAYVGDSTWEEKTWKEIVRLREDMFWARIGGVRE